MTHPAVSVVVVSIGRPTELHRCLSGLCQLDYPNFEIIVVADAESRTGIGVFQRRIKLVFFEEPNISAARNAGTARAAGDIVAFIDDDSVPEPTWLRFLTEPFSDPKVAITGGFVIGRNGISLQWGARQVAENGEATPLADWGTEPKIFDPKNGVIAKTEGTNMAVRTANLKSAGGFDEAFAFYLDETDVNMRLAAAGFSAALVPLAIVHHGFAKSARRTALRIPRDLTEIGASTALFQRKHSASMQKEAAKQQQRTRLLRHLVSGNLMPGDVKKLLKGFDHGWTAGLNRVTGQHPKFAEPDAFLPVAVHQSGHEHLVARFWQEKTASARAAKVVAEGSRATLFLFSLTLRRHRVWFDQRGFWVQRGGQFGAAKRSDPAFRFWRARLRADHEMARVSQVRQYGGR